MKDAGKKTTLQSSMAKLFAGEISVRVCEEAVQIHGGYLAIRKTIRLRSTGAIRNCARLAKARLRFSELSSRARSKGPMTDSLLIGLLLATQWRWRAPFREVEDNAAAAADLMKQIFPRTGATLIVGITGAPGAGKSSLVDKLASFYRKSGDRVGIIAVDPSSPFSGGAILGDRIRMQTLTLDKDVFIRSMATRGNLGGLARATVEAVAILDAAGYDKIIVETVGVGQDEIEIAKTADVCVVVLVPGMGDDVQTMKAGIMEIADVLVINKADRDGVLRTEKELQALLSLATREDEWQPPIVKTVAIENKGLDDLARAIDVSHQFQRNAPAAEGRKRAIAKWRILELLRERLVSEALTRAGAVAKLESMAGEVANKQRDPYSAVEELLEVS
jgi:LAO/AO transport system kinase